MILKWCFFNFIHHLGSNTDCTSPTLVEKLKDQNVVDVACGSGDAHTLAVTADGEFEYFMLVFNGLI